MRDKEIRYVRECNRGVKSQSGFSVKRRRLFLLPFLQVNISHGPSGRIRHGVLKIGFGAVPKIFPFINFYSDIKV